jgi:hypothetical protein
MIFNDSIHLDVGAAKWIILALVSCPLPLPPGTMTEASTQVQCRIVQKVQNSIVRTCACMCELHWNFKFSFSLYFLEHCHASYNHRFALLLLPYLSSSATPYLILPVTPYLTFPLSLCLISVLMKKDLRLAVDAAESRKIPLPTARLALSTYTALCETGLSHKDFSVVYDHLSKMKWCRYRRYWRSDSVCLCVCSTHKRRHTHTHKRAHVNT